MKLRDKVTISFTYVLPEGVEYECCNEYFCEAIEQLNKLQASVDGDTWSQVKFFDGMSMKFHDGDGVHDSHVTSEALINANSTC